MLFQSLFPLHVVIHTNFRVARLRIPRSFLTLLLYRQHIKISMLDTVVAFMWPEAMAAHTFLEDGEMAKLTKQGVMYVRDMIYECNDGKYVTVGVTQPQPHCSALLTTTPTAL